MTSITGRTRDLDGDEGVARSRSAYRIGLAVGIAAAAVGVALPLLTWPLTFSNILIVIVFVTMMLRRADMNVLRVRLGALDALFLIYLGWRLFAELYNAAQLDHPVSLGTLFELIVVYFAFQIARASITSLQTFIAFLKGVLLPSIPVAILGPLQVAGVDQVHNFLVNWTSSQGLQSRLERDASLRATSTIGHWTALGGYLLVVITLACVLLVLIRRTEQKLSAYALAILLIAVLGQVSTFTFATIAVSGAVLVVTAILVGLRPIVVIPLVGVTLVGLQFFQSQFEDRVLRQAAESNYTDRWDWLPETLSYRMWVWTEQTIPAIAERPLTGWGVNVYNFDWVWRPASLVWTSPESEWMRTAISVGIVGLAIQVAMLLVVWFQVLPAARAAVDKAVLPFRIGFLGLMVISFTHSHLTNRGVPLLLWVGIGALVAVGQRITQQREVVSPSVSEALPTRKAGH